MEWDRGLIRIWPPVYGPPFCNQSVLMVSRCNYSRISGLVLGSTLPGPCVYLRFFYYPDTFHNTKLALERLSTGLLDAAPKRYVPRKK